MSRQTGIKSWIMEVWWSFSGLYNKPNRRAESVGLEKSDESLFRVCFSV